jgi:F-type H+-transporting ATPase subunit delta
LSVASAETSAVSERYANALFDLARDQKALDQVDKALSAFLGLLSDNPDLQRLVRSPVFSAAEQRAGLEAVLDKAQIGGLARDFFGVLARNRRLFIVRAAAEAFQRRLARERGEVEAEITAAVPLTRAQEQELGDALREKLGKIPKLRVRVDPSILGGLIVKVGSRMIDTSIRTRLNTLKVAMREAG